MVDYLHNIHILANQKAFYNWAELGLVVVSSDAMDHVMPASASVKPRTIPIYQTIHRTKNTGSPAETHAAHMGA